MITSWIASALSILALAGPRPDNPPPSPPPPLAPITILSVGDSLTYGADGSSTASYRSEMSSLLSRTGQPHTWVVAAMGGSKCSWWRDRIDGLITQHDPDLVILNCGTNDTPGDATESDYRVILSIVQARSVRMVASLIGQPDMESPTNSVRPEIWGWMHDSSLAIAQALADYPAVPYADFSRIPNNVEWLQPDGIHFTPRAEYGTARLLYAAARTVMPGWQTLMQMRVPEMCGLHGHWRGDPWPEPDVAYRVCRT